MVCVFHQMMRKFVLINTTVVFASYRKMQCATAEMLARKRWSFFLAFSIGSSALELVHSADSNYTL